MERVDVKDAKDRLDELIARARAGERVVITEHGQAVAALTTEVTDRAMANARTEVQRRQAALAWLKELAADRPKLKAGAPDAATLIRRMRDEGH